MTLPKLDKIKRDLANHEYDLDKANEEIAKLRTFLRRCADHMIAGSNIAETPLPTEEEWREILQ